MSQVHEVHPRLPGFDPEAILHDGCPVCEKRAAAGLGGLLELDARNLNRLWRRMLNERMYFKVTAEHQQEWGGYRSQAERDLGETLYLMGVLEEKRRDPSDTWDADRFQSQYAEMVERSTATGGAR